MSKTAYIFPGQGSQSVGMGKDLYDTFPAARSVFEEADDALGFSLSDLCFSGDESELQLTANTQPAILTVSVAAYRAAIAEGLAVPAVAAGHSLGEYSALVAAGMMEFSDAVRTVRLRGTYMQEAVPVGVGAMAAILGLGIEEVDAGCSEAAEGMVCSAANINSPSQIVIAGNAEAVERACVILKEKGAKRAIMLNVSAPFHCALMMSAQERLAADLAKVNFRDGAYPVVHNVDAGPNSRGAAAADKLIRQVSSPVRWLESVKGLIASGVDNFVEIGPGKVLTGLVRQIDREVRYANIENTEGLNSALDNN